MHIYAEDVLSTRKEPFEKQPSLELLKKYQENIEKIQKQLKLYIYDKV